MNEISIDYIKKEFSKVIKGNLLDLGCGTTEMILEFCNSFLIEGNIFGIEDDRDKKVWEYFRVNIEVFAKNYKNYIENSWIKTYNCDLEKITIFPKSIESFLEEREKPNFELVVVNNVLHFYNNESERLKIYRGIYNCLSESGGVYIQVASEDHRTYKDRNDISVFNAEKIQEEINKTSFNFLTLPSQVEDKGNWHFILRK